MVKFSKFPTKVYLSEKTLTATAGRCRIIYVDIVVLGRNWFLHKRFIKRDTIYLDMVLRLD